MGLNKSVDLKSNKNNDDIGTDFDVKTLRSNIPSTINYWNHVLGQTLKKCTYEFTHDLSFEQSLWEINTKVKGRGCSKYGRNAEMKYCLLDLSRISESGKTRKELAYIRFREDGQVFAHYANPRMSDSIDHYCQTPKRRLFSNSVMTEPSRRWNSRNPMTPMKPLLLKPEIIAKSWVHKWYSKVRMVLYSRFDLKIGAAVMGYLCNPELLSVAGRSSKSSRVGGNHRLKQKKSSYFFDFFTYQFAVPGKQNVTHLVHRIFKTLASQSPADALRFYCKLEPGTNLRHEIFILEQKTGDHITNFHVKTMEIALSSATPPSFESNVLQGYAIRLDYVEEKDRTRVNSVGFFIKIDLSNKSIDISKTKVFERGCFTTAI